MKNTHLRPKPFVKWAGGKTRMLKELRPFFKKWDKHRYVEPFVGGGALLFDLQRKKALINDYNKELITAYRVIQDDSQIEILMEILNDVYQGKERDEPFYKKVRAKIIPDDPVEATARFIYLNKSCFNGLYRVNTKGKFNVPMGKSKSPPKLFDKNNLMSCHEFLKSGVEIFDGDYYNTLEKIQKNDVVYLDPPYKPFSKTSSFTQYTEKDFIDSDQNKLKDYCDHLNEIGAKFVLSNSNVNYIKKLYNNYSNTTKEVMASRSIGANKYKGKTINTRKKVGELIITNF
jgi:DNA adenine methylase|tara:strand:- start:75 stop:938 length:864 start_codon:yes stop_codon:yes gene_type:complete